MMSRVEDFITSRNIQQFAGTAEGIARLEQDWELHQMAEAFAYYEHQDVLTGRETLGQGDFGIVAAMGNLAIKVSTPSTNISKKVAEEDRAATNLVDQFTYMTALGEHLQTQPDSDIRAPRQFFAFTTAEGNSMHVQERVRDACTLGEWEEKHPAVYQQEETRRRRAIHERLSRTVDNDHPLWEGMSDLLPNRPPYIHLGNLLVPIETEKPEYDRLYIIDQPGAGKYGTLAARQAHSYLRERTATKTGPFGLMRKYGRPIIRRYNAAG